MLLVLLVIFLMTLPLTEQKLDRQRLDAFIREAEARGKGEARASRLASIATYGDTRHTLVQRVVETRRLFRRRGELASEAGEIFPQPREIAGELGAACARVARKIHADGVRVVGFVPSNDTVARSVTRFTDASSSQSLPPHTSTIMSRLVDSQDD